MEKGSRYLELENEFRSLLFSDLTPDQIDAYREGISLPPAKREERNNTAETRNDLRSENRKTV
jgi:hypothetical protein